MGVNSILKMLKHTIVMIFKIYKMMLINIWNNPVKIGVFSMLQHNMDKLVIFGIILSSSKNLTYINMSYTILKGQVMTCGWN